MTIRRITRNRRLTAEESAKYKKVRERVAEELPELIARHHERLSAFDQLGELLKQLKVAREERGLSLSDLTDLTGMDRSAISNSRRDNGPIRPSRRLCATPRQSGNILWSR